MSDTTPNLAEIRPELAKTLALMRLMAATRETVHLSGPALADVLAELAELDGLRARVAVLEADVRGTAAARDSWRAETLAHRAELEAGETRTEWRAVEPTGRLHTLHSIEGRRPYVPAWLRRRGAVLEWRECRERVGPWVPVEDEAGA